MSLSSPKLILASGSAIRRQILDGAGLTYSSVTSDVDEEVIKREMLADSRPFADIALQLARAKALAVGQNNKQDNQNAYIIGADQIMVMDDVLYDKPKNLDEARDRLWGMRGRPHFLIGSVVVTRGESVIWHHNSKTTLNVRSFSKDFLTAYIAAEGESLLSSVGAYKFEGRGAQLFESVEGDFFSILGLSLLPLLDFLRVQKIIAS